MSTTTPPGWYPDGQGQPRYWDGERWTEGTAAATPSSKPAKTGAPWWKAVWVLPVGVGIVALLIGVAAGGGGKPKTKTVAGPTTTATATTTETATSTLTTTPTVIKTIATKTQTVRVTYTPPVKVAFSDGEFRVNSEIKPGTYHTDGSGDCYWERDNKGDGIDKIIDNGNVSGPTTIDIESSDYSFTSNGGCDWTRVG